MGGTCAKDRVETVPTAGERLKSTPNGLPARVLGVRFYPLDKLTYTEDERGIILQNLKNLALFVQSVNDAKKKVNK